MKERQILFSAPMIRAILDGRKTVTRRVVKDADNVTRLVPDHGFKRALTHIVQWWRSEPYTRHWHCPYGQVGDRLWVRETFAHGIHALNAKRDEDGPFVYAADAAANQGRLGDKWTPSIFMPRAASRIDLEITGVRVERLNDISEADAVAEGCGDYLPSRSRFITLWESINGAGSWAANPFVWVVAFKRVKP